MKKFFLLSLIILTIGLIATPPLIENQVEHWLTGELNQWKTPQPAKVEAVQFSFWQRTLTVKNLFFALQKPDGIESYAIAEATAQIPLSLLTNALHLWQNPNSTSPIELAENFSFKDLTSTVDQGQIHYNHIHGSHFAIDGNYLYQLLQGQAPQTAQTQRYLHVENLVAEDTTLQSYASQQQDTNTDKVADFTLTTARYIMQGLHNAHVKMFRAEDCAVSGEGQPILHLQSFQCNDITPVSDDLYARILSLNESSSLQEITDCLKQVLLQPKPLVAAINLEGLTLDNSLLPLSIPKITFDWRGTSPWDSSLLMQASMPASAIAKAYSLHLPKLHTVEGTLDVTVTELGENTFREKISLTCPELADISCNIIQTWHGQMNSTTKTNAMMNITLNDASLRATDHGLLAYAALFLTQQQPENLPVLLQNIRTELQALGQSDEAIELSYNILNFIQKPGTLELSLREKPLGMLALLAYAGNPAALIKTNFTPGAVFLESQLRALSSATATGKE